MILKPHRYLLPVIVFIVLLGTATALQLLPQTETLQGQVVTEKNAPVPDAICSLSGHTLPQGSLQTTTDGRGNFSFPALLPGSYSLTCAAVGRKPVSKPNILVVDGEVIAPLRISLPLEVFHQEITVHATAGNFSTRRATTPSSFSAHQLITLPLAELKFKAALPLVPGVVRTPDGKLNIKGAPEEQGLLLVDGADLVDPVTGAFSVEVPIDAIEELQAGLPF